MIHSLKVSVCGETVHVRSDQPAQVVERVVSYLNEKVREAGKSAMDADKFRLLVLAALNVAGEVFELQSKLEEYDKAKHRMLVQAKSLTETLDRAIAPAG